MFQYLQDTNHWVKRICLKIIGTVSTSENLGLLAEYIHSQDARVRSAAFSTLVRIYICILQSLFQFYFYRFHYTMLSESSIPLDFWSLCRSCYNLISHFVNIAIEDLLYFLRTNLIFNSFFAISLVFLL